MLLAFCAAAAGFGEGQVAVSSLYGRGAGTQLSAAVGEMLITKGWRKSLQEAVGAGKEKLEKFSECIRAAPISARGNYAC